MKTPWNAGDGPAARDLLKSALQPRSWVAEPGVAPIMDISTTPQQPQTARFAAAEDPRREPAPRSARSPARPRNRRSHARVEARGVASHLQSRDGSTPGLPVANISMGGLFVRSAIAFEPGTPVMLQIVRPGLKRAIQMTGRVVSVVSPAEAGERGSVAGMGIVLDCLDRDAEPRLRALIDELAGLAPAPRLPTSSTTPRAPSPPVPDPNALDLDLDLAAARDEGAAHARRIEQLEAEVKALRGELLRRNRTIGDLANKLAAFEEG